MNFLGRPLTYYLRRIAAVFGSPLKGTDGKTICRAFVLYRRGRIKIIGAPAEILLRPVAVPQPRLTYWMQEIAWEIVNPPDFDRVQNDFSGPAGDVICHVIICHLGPGRISEIVETWKNRDPSARILIAHGGKKEDFASLPPDIEAIYISDPALRTLLHSREKQEYAGVMRGVAQWLVNNPEISHIHLVEYDVAPTVDGLGQLLVSWLNSQNADVIGSGVHDLTGSIHPHALYHQASEAFVKFVESISVREDKHRILCMLGCSSTWTRACFLAVASLNLPERIYLEIALASLPHHLGWRVRALPDVQQAFMSFQGDFSKRVSEFSERGAWMVHPCKTAISERRLSPATDINSLPAS